MIISLSFSAIIYQISSTELGKGLRRQTNFLRELSKSPFENPIQDFERMRAEQLEGSANRLKLNLIYFNLLILFLSSILSYYFARRTLKPIEDMVEAQNNFTGDASHELRTPLTAMRTEIEVGMRDKKLKLAGAKKILSSNLEEISKLETLSNALLKLTKYEDKKIENFEKVNLEDIIIEAYEKIEKLANKKKIRFKNNFKNVYIKGNKQSLVELFVILLDNAIKYSPKNSKVSINIKKNGKYGVVTISDQGIGIKASDIPHIFNRFYRADISRNKEKTDGYGLGLSIAKRIVEIHKGTISAESQIGKGSDFIVHLRVL